MKWYKRLLCGYNTLGDIADFACTGTETEYELSDQDIYMKRIEVRCWCCTFWRGVIFGVLVSLAVFVVLLALLHDLGVL